MTAKVSFADEAVNATASTAAGYLIPAQALYQINNKAQVWVVRERKAQLVEVTVAGYAGNDIIISQGLSQGDKVVTAGLAKLIPNQEVRLEEGGEA